MVVLFPINSTKNEKDQPNGSCVTGMCDHHFLEPGLLSFRNLPKRTSPKGTVVAIQKMKVHLGELEFLNVYIVHIYTCVYMGYIYIYIHILSFMYNSRSVYQYLIYIHHSLNDSLVIH